MKFQKIFHLPWSKSLDKDDKIIPDISCLDGKNLIYLEKLDGENTACSREVIHARSEDGYGKPWQHYMKKYYSCFKNDIPEDMTFFGECVYAIHSITYDSFPTCFFVFGVLYGDEWLSWTDTLAESALIGFDVVPEITVDKLFKMPIPSKSSFGPTCEGYVARNILSYKIEDFQTNVAKVVRENHVKTDIHWTKNWKPAKFIEDPIERLYARKIQRSGRES